MTDHNPSAGNAPARPNRLGSISDAAEQEAQMAEIAAAMDRMDKTEKLIFVSGARAMLEGRLTTETFEEKVGELLARHRAGDDVRLSDLDFAP